jgi:hypothetical protein
VEFTLGIYLPEKDLNFSPLTWIFQCFCGTLFTDEKKHQLFTPLLLTPEALMEIGETERWP